MSKKLLKIIIIILSLGIISITGFLIWKKYKIVNDAKKSAQIQNENAKQVMEEVRKRDLENKKRYSLGDGYSYYGKSVYYNDNFLEEADGSSLIVMGGGFAKDDKLVFYKGVKMDDIDAQTFVRPYKSALIFKDKNRGYYMGETLSLVDADNLVNFLVNDIGGKDLGGRYRLYGGKIYYWHEKDDNYYPTMIYVENENKTFEVVTDDGLAKSKNNYYLQGENISKNYFETNLDEYNNRLIVSDQWRLISGDLRDTCSRPSYVGNVRVHGWYEWGRIYADEGWIFVVDKKDADKLIKNYNGAYTLTDAPNLLIDRLKKASKENPMSITVKRLNLYCEGLPRLNL